ncbi:MAG: aldo/keto reductase [Balneolaceae bacterium]
MKRQKLHPKGPEFSKLAVGLWRMNEWNLTTDQTIAWIEHCIELGITTFDHADIYGMYQNEELFGNAIKQKPSLLDEIELVTKCDICLVSENRPENSINHYNTTPEHIITSVERSLKNLNAEVLDLVLIHRPDPLMDASATADAFMKLIEQGKIKHIGVSNFTPSQVDLLQSRLDVPIVTNQVEFSLHRLDPIFDGTFDQAQRMEASPMLWSPFAGGAIFKEHDERTQQIRNTANKLCEKYECELDQIILAWLMMIPSNPIPVLGTGKTERITSGTKACNIKLERQDWFKLLVASQGHPVP